MARPMVILIAGPYRSGTGDDPDLMYHDIDEIPAA